LCFELMDCLTTNFNNMDWTYGLYHHYNYEQLTQLNLMINIILFHLEV